ncbi:MAG: amidohydrolase family protein [Candidatus Nanopelagicales bacterium]|nr:amidohydrolase family protein [Candidatus Nanopelagicales bacterium]
MAEKVLDTDAIMGDLRIIDGDSHFSEPADLWTSRAPASYRDRMPKWERVNGQTVWTIDGKFWCGIGGSTINKNMEKVLGTLSLPVEDIADDAWTVKGRLNIMDQQGVYAEVLFPNSIGFASNAVMSIDDVEFRNVVSRVYNDGMLDAQNESGGRLLPQAILPVWDMDLTLKEMTRLHEAGIRGFTITDKPHLIGLPDLDQPYFAPLWSLANDMGTVLNFHIGSSVVPLGEGQGITDSPMSDIFWQSFGPQRRLAILATQFYMSNARIITNLIMSDMFERYPNVKVVSAESGIGWVPFMLEACEYQLDEMVTTKEERSLQKRRPTEYFRSNVYVMSWFERSAMKILDDVGVDNVMIETDIPHPTCLYPNSRDHFADVTRNLTPEVRRKLVQDNAARVYRVELPD